jgi:glucosamine-6-phosphate deaminase
VTFNLDEYYPIKASDSNSYHYYMHHNLFKHIDIPPENINLPNGELNRQDVIKFCEDYEKKIKSYGGIDIQILGVGRTGHIGFNEPPSPINSITRLVYLNKITRKDTAHCFGGYDKVPKCAISMGISTIKKAKKIVIVAWS